MSLLEELIDLEDAAEIAGRAQVTMRRAAAIGRLEARRIGRGRYRLWVTTRSAVSDYMAYVASVEWQAVPQRQRQRRRSRTSRAARGP